MDFDDKEKSNIFVVLKSLTNLVLINVWPRQSLLGAILVFTVCTWLLMIVLTCSSYLTYGVPPFPEDQMRWDEVRWKKTPPVLLLFKVQHGAHLCWAAAGLELPLWLSPPKSSVSKWSAMQTTDKASYRGYGSACSLSGNFHGWGLFFQEWCGK